MSGYVRGSRGATPQRGWVAWLRGRPGFTAGEVRELLRDEGDEARAQAVRRCLARPGDWLNPPPDIFTLPWRYHRHLPRIAFWYARGETTPAIAARLGSVLSPWAAERCLAVACARIAVCINHDPTAYGLLR